MRTLVTNHPLSIRITFFTDEVLIASKREITEISRQEMDWICKESEALLDQAL
jgi:hypothetical protein